MKPILTDNTLDHLIIDLNHRVLGEATDIPTADFIQIKKEYLIIFIWIRSVTGAIAASEVVIVVISDVFFVFGL